MKQYAVIRDRDSNKNAAVLVHDEDLGRCVFKCRNVDWPLQQAFDAWADRQVIAQESKSLNGSSFTIRKKITRFNDRYIEYLIDRFVKRPYEVRSLLHSDSTVRLDDFADKMAAEVL